MIVVWGGGLQTEPNRQVDKEHSTIIITMQCMMLEVARSALSQMKMPMTMGHHGALEPRIP
jgi:hypothetical protein